MQISLRLQHTYVIDITMVNFISLPLHTIIRYPCQRHCHYIPLFVTLGNDITMVTLPLHTIIRYPCYRGIIHCHYRAAIVSQVFYLPMPRPRCHCPCSSHNPGTIAIITCIVPVVLLVYTYRVSLLHREFSSHTEL
jgi:hypothetical protein